MCQVGLHDTYTLRFHNIDVGHKVDLHYATGDTNDSCETVKPSDLSKKECYKFIEALNMAAHDRVNCLQVCENGSDGIYGVALGNGIHYQRDAAFTFEESTFFLRYEVLCTGEKMGERKETAISILHIVRVLILEVYVEERP